MSNMAITGAKNSPPFSGYTENLKSVTLAAPVLTWGSPALTRAPAQLIYRNPGGVGLIVGNYGNDCVCYEAV